jgi:pilus assembly protein Flp/PilA
MLKWMRLFRDDERGANAVEYGLLAALIAVGCILAFTAFGSNLANLFGANDSGAGKQIRDAADSM